MFEYEKTNPSINYGHDQLVADDAEMFASKVSFKTSKAKKGKRNKTKWE